jgi:hypothetical protein
MEISKLNPGDVFCYKCEGKGLYCFYESRHVSIHYCDSGQCGTAVNKCKGIQHCSECHGDGKLDWIENIVGKESKKPRLVKPGVYVREIDSSAYIPLF